MLNSQGMNDRSDESGPLVPHVVVRLYLSGDDAQRFLAAGEVAGDPLRWQLADVREGEIYTAYCVERSAAAGEGDGGEDAPLTVPLSRDAPV